MVLKIEAQRNKKPQQPIFLPIREVTLQRKDNAVLIRTVSSLNTQHKGQSWLFSGPRYRRVSMNDITAGHHHPSNSDSDRRAATEVNKGTQYKGQQKLMRLAAINV
jgi:hypothetical protein